MDHGEEVGSCLFIAGRDRAESFESVEEALYLSAQLVELSGASAPVELASWVHRDDGLHPATSHRFDDMISVVAGVGDYRFAGRVLDEVLSFGHVVLLSRRERDFEGLPFGRRNCVNLGRKASSRTAQTIASDPPFPPAASWWARTTVASMREPTLSPSSASIRSSLKIRSQIPRAAQRANRLYTDFQGPYRSWRSRHGTPVRTRQMTALRKLRSPRRAIGPRRRGSNALIRAHSSSVSSCRCTASVDQQIDPRATSISEIAPRPNCRHPAHRADHENRDTP